MTPPGPWPELHYADWEPTKQTLHRYAQMMGKVRTALVPFRNHWWHATLLISTHGMTTGPMPCGELSAEVELDVVDHRLHIRTSEGRSAGFPLRDRFACARFYYDLFAELRAVGVAVEIHPEPFDLGDSPAFADDTVHDRYDADAVARWWRILRLTNQALDRFASRFNGKTSPTQLFWHSFDFAHARFSGRRAPAIAGTDPVTAEAYSHGSSPSAGGPATTGARLIRRSTPIRRPSPTGCATDATCTLTRISGVNVQLARFQPAYPAPLTFVARRPRPPGSG